MRRKKPSHQSRAGRTHCGACGAVAHGRPRRAVAARRARGAVLRRRPCRRHRARHPAAADAARGLIGATLGLSGAALQGLLRNPLAEPALFGAPQAAAAAAALVIAFGFAPVTSFAVPVAGILGATISDCGACRHRGPPREPDGDAARRSCAGELRGRHDGADPQPRAEPVHRAGNRVLAARLAGGPLDRSSHHCGAVHDRELGRCSP